jgi:signal transduction histidine kinase
LTRLVGDLLDVSRISKGKIYLKREELDLRLVVERAAETARTLTRERGHTFLVSLCEHSLPILGDATRLEQIVLNLLGNAAKYTEPGGRIWLDLYPMEAGGLISIRDTGVGIANEMLARVFDLFVQEHRSQDRSLGGLGVGLALVKKLTEMHGGRVTVESGGPGKGSEFRVWIPLRSE